MKILRLIVVFSVFGWQRVGSEPSDVLWPFDFDSDNVDGLSGRIASAVGQSFSHFQGGSAELLAVKELHSLVSDRCEQLVHRRRDAEAASAIGGLTLTLFRKVQSEINAFYNCMLYPMGVKAFSSNHLAHCCQKVNPADVAQNFAFLLTKCVEAPHRFGEVSNATVHSALLSYKIPFEHRCEDDQDQSFEEIFKVLRSFLRSDSEQELMKKVRHISAHPLLHSCYQTRLCRFQLILRHLSTIMAQYGPSNRHFRQYHEFCFLPAVAEIAWGRRAEFDAYNEEFANDFTNIAIMSRMCQPVVDPSSGIDMVQDVNSIISPALHNLFSYSNSSLDSFWRIGMLSRLKQMASLFTGLNKESQIIATKLYERMKVFGPKSDNLLVIVAPVEYRCIQKCPDTECLFYEDAIAHRIFYLIRKSAKTPVLRDHGLPTQGFGNWMCSDWEARTYQEGATTIVFNTHAHRFADELCKFSIGVAGAVPALQNVAQGTVSNFHTVDVCTYNAVIAA